MKTIAFVSILLILNLSTIAIGNNLSSKNKLTLDIKQINFMSLTRIKFSVDNSKLTVYNYQEKSDSIYNMKRVCSKKLNLSQLESLDSILSKVGFYDLKNDTCHAIDGFQWIAAWQRNNQKNEITNINCRSFAMYEVFNYLNMVVKSKKRNSMLSIGFLRWDNTPSHSSCPPQNEIATFRGVYPTMYQSFSILNF